jgi:hypothetical protein
MPETPLFTTSERDLAVAREKVLQRDVEVATLKDSNAKLRNKLTDHRMLTGLLLFVTGLMVGVAIVLNDYLTYAKELAK